MTSSAPLPLTSLTADALLEAMQQYRASDLYITVGCPPNLRVNNRLAPLGEQVLNEDSITQLLSELLSVEQIAEFRRELELNTSINRHDRARFRINVFQQQLHTGIVIRLINTSIPALEELHLPKVYADAILRKRGLILVAGMTGCGKSTSLAAMLGYRNTHGMGHIITIEDPIEFVHTHQRCIITQREVGIDTVSYGTALKNALRQRPDVILIGEIRDRDTMEHALNFAESGHLCLATLHANNANQTIQRVVNLFPSDQHKQILYNLSLNLIGVFSQRLVANRAGARSLALEIMLNEGLITNLIKDGSVKEIKELMEKNESSGMCSFDQSLARLYRKGEISAEVAIAEADTPSNMRLTLRKLDEEIKQERDVGATGMIRHSGEPRRHLNLPGIPPTG